MTLWAPPENHPSRLHPAHTTTPPSLNVSDCLRGLTNKGHIQQAALSRLPTTRPGIIMATRFSDLSNSEVQLIAEALKGTTWIALFSRVSKACRNASIRAEDDDEAALRRLNVRDLVRRVELATWALDQGCPRSLRQGIIGICAAAVRGGHLETLKWVRASGCEWNEQTVCCFAALEGHLEVGPTVGQG